MEAHSCNGKALRITHSECVSVASVIQYEMRMRHVVICGLPGLQYFSTLAHKNMIFENKNFFGH
jgi:hypothetical protein